MVKAALTLITGLLAVAQAFNNPPGVKVWCGKAYMASNASFNPGGQLTAPKPAASPMLDLKVRPRMSLYTADDTAGSFIVDAVLSYIHGKPYTSSPSDGGHPSANSTKKNSLVFDVSLVDGGQTLVHGKSVPVNSTGHEFNFSLAGLAPRKQPYQVQLTARDAGEGGGAQTYKATTEVLHLPARKDGGSATKIDSLHGGLLVQDWTRNSTAWEPLYPYSYYASWSGYFQNNASAPGTFRSLGYNIVHIVPDGSVPLGFDESQFDAFLNECDRVGLRVMYDMRWSYLNTSAVAAQVARYSRHPSVLLWYTADEPDGATDPLNGTLLAYRAVKSVDPYRPVSLVLNCANFYYEEYTRGADIVLEDAYPVGINATYSVEWHTPCNDTYGDCGCDDCHGSLRDISDRLDSLAAYQTWIGGGATDKPLWGVPQAFNGSDEYWAGAPDAAQEVAMDLLSINHGAKGLVAWTWPTEPDLASVTSRLAKVLTAPQITGFLLGAPLVSLTDVSGATNAGALDVASWRLGKSMLVSVAYLKLGSVSGPVKIALPQGSKAKAVASTPWASGGSSSWTIDGSGGLVKSGLQRLETALLIIDLA